MTILEAALGNPSLRKAQRDDIRQVLYTVICARQPLTTKGLSELLGIHDIERVRAALRPLWSVLHVVGANELVTTLHASFPDFMFESTRSSSYYCNSDAHHRKLAEHCFEYITQTQPQFNICGLESAYLLDEHVPNIQTRVAKSISLELMYACRYWAEHIKCANCALSMVEQARDFLSTRLLLWMEVLNLTNQMRAGVECLNLMTEWCEVFEKEQELSELANDAKRFVETFASNPVSQSTPHIYVSMMTFWPKSSPLAKHYAKYTRGPIQAEGTALDRRQLAHLSTWAFEKPVWAMAVSPDGLHIALAIENDVLVVDSSNGKLALGPLQDHPNQVSSVVFTPDGSRILAGSIDDSNYNATILGWDTRTGDAVLGPLQLQGHSSNIWCLSFASDCSRIATGSEDSTLRLWDMETGRMLHQLGAQGPVYSAVFSPDGTQIAAGTGKILHRWDSHTGESTSTPLTHADDVHMIAYSPDQHYLISGSWDSNAIYVWSTLSEDMVRSTQGHAGYITCLEYSPDGKYIVSGSSNRSVRLWDAQSGELMLGPLEGHTKSICSITFSPDSSRIISGCYGGLVCTWNARQRNLTHSARSGFPDHIACVKFTSDGTRFVCGSTRGTISIWDVHTGATVFGPVQGHISPINAVDVRNDRIASGTIDGKICVCDARNGEVVLGPLQVVSRAINAIAYSPDGELISTASFGRIDVWHVQDSSLILGPLTDLDDDVRSVQFSPNGTRIVASSDGDKSNVVVWALSDGRSVFGALDGHHRSVNSVSYSPNGALIASGSEDQTIIIWDAYTGRKAIGPLTGHSKAVHSVSFSPDNTSLVSGSRDRTIRIWDVRTGQMAFELINGHEGEIRSVEYSPYGSHIISCSDDLNVRLHDARSPEERARSNFESKDWLMNKDGWVIGEEARLLVWVPGDLRKALMWPATRVVVRPQGYVRLKFDMSGMGESWGQSYTSYKY